MRCGNCRFSTEACCYYTVSIPLSQRKWHRTAVTGLLYISPGRFGNHQIWREIVIRLLPFDRDLRDLWAALLLNYHTLGCFNNSFSAIIRKPLFTGQSI